MVELSTRDKVSAEKVGEKYHVDRTTLYFWKSKMTTGEEIKLPDNCNTGNLEKDNEQLKLENERLRQENRTAIKRIEEELISTAKCEKRFKKYFMTTRAVLAQGVFTLNIAKMAKVYQKE